MKNPSHYFYGPGTWCGCKAFWQRGRLSWAHKLHLLQCLVLENSDFETRWDLGLENFCCSEDSWTNISSSNKIRRHSKGLKITSCMCNWGKLWATRYKKTEKTQLPLLKSWEQNLGTARASCTQHHQRGVNHLSHPPSWSEPWTYPFPYPIQGTCSPHLGEPARAPITCSSFLLLQQGPQ